MDDLKVLVKVIQGLGKLVKNIRELIDGGSEQDEIAEGLANEYEGIIQDLENLGRRGEGQQGGGELRKELIAGAEALEEAATDPGISSRQQTKLLVQARRLRQKVALLDAEETYNFSDLLSPEEFKEFAELIANGKAAVQDRQALKETLDTVVNLVVIAAKMAAKL